jgi:excinuclease ABC subunit A
MGPGGGPDGGHILAAGTPEDVARAPASVTGPWLAEHLGEPEYVEESAGGHR